MKRNITLREFMLRYPSHASDRSPHEACPLPEMPCAEMSCTAGDEEAPPPPQEAAIEIRFEPSWPFFLGDPEC